MENYLFTLWIFLMAFAAGKVAIAYHTLQEELKAFDAETTESSSEVGY